ncbi:unnamed protein product [Aphanomyces euteiches]
MKLNLFSVVASAILAATADASPVAEQDAQGGYTLSGTYSNSNSLTSCSTVVISSLTVPAGVTLDLTNLKDGATVSFTGTTTFGTKLWEGPLVLLTGTNLKVTGPGTLDGQGACYWKQGQSVTRPVFFRLTHVDQSTLTGFTLKNSPFRTFSILNSVNTQLTGLTLDSKAGDGLAKNTDGFDLKISPVWALDYFPQVVMYHLFMLDLLQDMSSRHDNYNPHNANKFLSAGCVVSYQAQTPPTMVTMA